MDDERGMTIEEVAERSGVGRTCVYQDIAERRLIARKRGRKTIVLHSDFIKWLRGLPEAVGAAA
jgi:excisionase family DNA binding protein